MAVRVVLTNKAQQTREIASNTTTDTDIQLSRVLYQHLRSLAKNKVIVNSYNQKTLPKEYVYILDEFTKLLKGESVSDSIKNLDNYLGSLGITARYHYDKDVIDIAPWLNVENQALYRNVIAEVGDIIYNVIAEVGGIDYNVTHDTNTQTIGVKNAN